MLLASGWNRSNDKSAKDPNNTKAEGTLTDAF